MIGITSSLSSYNVIKDNTITGDTWVGISLTVSDNCQVLDNNIVLDYTIRNSDYPCTGIWLYAYCYENRIISNIISGCDTGISISSSSNNILEKNYITDCHVFNTLTQLIDNNYLISAEDEPGTIIPIKTRGIGIFLEDAIANEFRFNNVLENDINLVLFSSYFNKIRFNNIEDSTTGISILLEKRRTFDVFLFSFSYMLFFPSLLKVQVFYLEIHLFYPCLSSFYLILALFLRAIAVIIKANPMIETIRGMLFFPNNKSTPVAIINIKPKTANSNANLDSFCSSIFISPYP